MGKIKKILEKELGSTQSVEVYPVTSIEAVYDENNERLDNIINRKNKEIQKELEAEVTRATNAESNLRETINNITEINENATSANIVTIDTIPNTSSSNVQQALNELFKNATFAGIATPTTNPGTPDGPVFYIATTAGNYSNFGSIKVLNGESAILRWNNGVWVKNTFKPMTDFNSVFDANGKSLTSKLDTLGSNISELDIEIGKKVSNEDIANIGIVQKNKDEFVFTDKNGYIVAKIDKDGLIALSVKDKDGNSIKDISTLSQIIENFIKVFNLDKHEGEFVFADKDGYIVAKIDKDGLQALSIKDKDGNEIKKYEIDERLGGAFVFCDSKRNIVGKIGKTTQFEKLIDKDGNEIHGYEKYEVPQKLKGKTFAIIGDSYRVINSQIPKYGGKVFLADTADRGQITIYGNQAQHIIDAINNGMQIDYIIVQDVHQIVDSDGRIPYWVKHTYSGDTYASAKKAREAFDNSFQSIVSKFNPTSMARIKCPIGTITQTIDFSLQGSVANEGTISVSCFDGETTYITSMHVQQGSSLMEVVNNLNEISFDNFIPWWSNNEHHQILSEPKIVFTYNDLGKSLASSSLVFNMGTTGVVASTPIFNTTTNGSAVNFCFGSRDVTEWNDKTKWFSIIDGEDVDWYNMKCGYIEHLQNSLPDIPIIILGHHTGEINLGDAKYYYPDGTIDIDRVMQNNSYWIRGEESMRVWEKIAKKYSCQYIDIYHNLGISPINWKSWFNDNDVHTFRHDLWDKRCFDIFFNQFNMFN